MLLSQDSNSGEYQIQSYKPGEFIINEKAYTQSVLISLTDLTCPWPPQTINDLSQELFAKIAALSPKIVILGTGEKQVFPDTELIAPLINKNIGVEIMDTAAACRTFMILCSEGRQVIGALLIS